MTLPEWVTGALTAPLRGFVTPGAPLFLPYLLVAVIIAMVTYVLRPDLAQRYGSMIAYVFDRRVLGHRSSGLDVRFFLVNGVLLYALHQVLTTDEGAVADRVVEALGGARSSVVEVGPLARIGVSVGALFALDLSTFLPHYLFHKVPILWEFHKVHHSAEVLNPLTLQRVHPVEHVAYGLGASAVMGIYVGAVTWGFGGYAPFLVDGLIDGIFLVFLFTYNLHHSHVYLRWPDPIGLVFYSPAHHHLHHSADPAHADKNFGVVFTMWDRIAGSHLDPPSVPPDLTLGVRGAPALHTTVAQLYLAPFVAAWRRLRGTGDA